MYDEDPKDQPTPGLDAEYYARRLAGDLGVPDFVYRPVLVPKGKAGREVSDGLLVAGTQGLILQVKSRDPDAALSDTLDKAQNWCLKNAKAAMNQAKGTRRTLASSNLRVTSLRGFERDLSGVQDWPAVIIVDHPLDPQVDLQSLSFDNAIAMSISDWRELHRYLRSTWGVISYVQRVLASNIRVDLGREQDRYAVLADADMQTTDSETSFPVIPSRPLGGNDVKYAMLLEDLIERLADPVGSTGWDPEQYLLIVEELDRQPPLGRAHLGKKMYETFRAMQSAKSRRSFMWLDPNRPRIRFAFLYQFDDSNDPNDDWFMAQVAAYGTLRHQHAIEAGADPDSITMAIGVLHSEQYGRRYAFYYNRGADLHLPAELREELEDQFGIFDGRSIREQ